MNNLLSIIVPVYNSEKYLSFCLDSIKNQKYENFECLLIDDGSTDNSSLICQLYSENDNRFKVLHKKNGGVASSRNFGVERANGEYIAFVDNDDLLDPNMYSILMRDLLLNKCDVACCGYIKDFRGYPEVIESLKDPVKITDNNVSIVLNDTESIFFSIVNGKGIEGLIWNKIYKTDVIKNIKFNEKISLVDDADFSLRLFKNIARVSFNNAMFKQIVDED